MRHPNNVDMDVHRLINLPCRSFQLPPTVFQSQRIIGGVELQVRPSAELIFFHSTHPFWLNGDNDISCNATLLEQGLDRWQQVLLPALLTDFCLLSVSAQILAADAFSLSFGLSTLSFAARSLFLGNVYRHYSD
jgi:hypothetical protein